MTMPVAGGVWGVIPARGGSRSIPRKNIAPLGGRPLIDYVIETAKASRRLSRILCSTDDAAIADACGRHGIEVQPRPAELGGDATPVKDVLVHLLNTARAGDAYPEGICLLQPTSPFVLPDDVDACVDMLLADPQASAVQTIAPLDHNAHAFNQRVLDGRHVHFRFPAERRAAYNKQLKPTHYVFGNLLLTRTRVILEDGDLFGETSLHRMIGRAYATDVDGPDDLAYAQWLLDSGRVVLPHLAGGRAAEAVGG